MSEIHETSRLFLDTNVLLDAVGERREGHAAALSLLSGKYGAELAVSAGSLKDFHYIAGHAKAGIGADGGLGESERRNWIRLFLDVATVLPDDRENALLALDSDEPDYEDATKRVAAERWNADWIVTRDGHRHAFERSHVPHGTAAEVIEAIDRGQMYR